MEGPAGFLNYNNASKLLESELKIYHGAQNEPLKIRHRQAERFQNLELLFVVPGCYCQNTNNKNMADDI